MRYRSKNRLPSRSPDVRDDVDPDSYMGARETFKGDGGLPLSDFASVETPVDTRHV